MHSDRLKCARRPVAPPFELKDATRDPLQSFANVVALLWRVCVRNWTIAVRWMVLVGGALLATQGATAQTPATAEAFLKAAEAAAEEEAHASGLEAYLYGYPRVEMARRIHNETQRVSAEQVIYAPVNRFYYFDRLAGPGDGRVIKAPNNDTVYGSAYLDLSQGPVVLRVPPMGDRYYVALVVDAAGNVGTRIGRKVTGPGGVDLAFVGPGYRGALPKGMRVLKQSANDLWVLMRVASTGGADEAVAAATLKRFTLSDLGSVRARPAEGRNTPIQTQPVVAPLTPLESLEYYQVLDRMLLRNPVPPEDRGLLARWERIGLGKGTFDAASLKPPVRRGLERAIASGRKIVAAAQFGIANNVNGWNYSDKIGRIRNDWSLNAAIALGGFGNMPDDSVYHQRNLDDRGDPLTGSKTYRMTFAAGQLPPVGAFWSITAYDQNSLDLMENPIRRYSLGDRTPGLQRAADGSLTLAIQATEPTDPALKANWLPIGPGPFYLIMRSYDPDPRIATGQWAPPPVTAAP